jgi:hypothetical protein
MIYIKKGLGFYGKNYAKMMRARITMFADRVFKAMIPK